MVGWSYNLPWVKGRLSKDDIIGGQAVDNKECNIFSDLLRIITNRNGQWDCAGGGGAVYLSPFEPNKKGIGWDQPFSVHPHLLECQVVEDVSRPSVVDQDSVCVVISYP